ncbi:MAG: hypothetical protein R2764_04100 [Bacteroidales bacterium]
MKKMKLSCILLLSVIIILSSCGKDDEKEDVTMDFDQSNAENLANIIKWNLIEVAPYYSSDNWNHEKMNGYASGYAIVDGSFSKWSNVVGYQNKEYREYDNVSVQFSDYSDHSSDPSITGSASMNGTITYQYSMGHTGDYGGTWIFKGTITCSGKYVGEASFYFTFVENNEYSGTLTFDGTSYQVSSD